MRYAHGPDARIGDIVLIGDQHQAVVEALLLAGTDEAREYSCAETGGVLMRYEELGAVLHRQIDADEGVAFLRRVTS